MKEKDLSKLTNAWLLFFSLGIIMLNYPFIQIFNKDLNLLGIPLVLAYFLIGWPLSILTIYIFSNKFKAMRGAKDNRKDS